MGPSRYKIGPERIICWQKENKSKFSWPVLWIGNEEGNLYNVEHQICIDSVWVENLFLVLETAAKK